MDKKLCPLFQESCVLCFHQSTVISRRKGKIYKALLCSSPVLSVKSGRILVLSFFSWKVNQFPNFLLTKGYFACYVDLTAMNAIIWDGGGGYSYIVQLRNGEDR